MECGAAVNLRYSNMRDAVNSERDTALEDAYQDYLNERTRIEDEVLDPEEQAEELNDLENDYNRTKWRITTLAERELKDLLRQELDEQQECLDNNPNPRESDNDSQPQDNQDGSEGGGADEDSFTPPYRLPYDIPVEPIGKVTVYQVGAGSGGSGTDSCQQDDDDGGVTCEQDSG